MRVPKYRKHTTRNLGFVEVNKKRKYFPGPFNSSESLAAYADFIKTIKPDDADTPEPEKTSVLFLVLRYLDWAKTRYSAGTYEELKYFAKPLIEHYGNTPSAKFGPLTLKKLREKLIESNLCRNSINKRIGGIDQLNSFRLLNLPRQVSDRIQSDEQRTMFEVLFQSIVPGNQFFGIVFASPDR